MHVILGAGGAIGTELVRELLAAGALGVAARHKVLGRAMAMVGGWFNPDVRESREMLYQYEFEYLFDSSRFEKAFGVKATPYAQGVELTAAAYRRATDEKNGV